MVEIVNISAGGDLKREVDLKGFADDVDLPVADYDEENGWLLLRFEEGGSLIILYRTGKYILRGGDTYEQCFQARDDFLELCQNMGLILSSDETEFEIKNVVCLGDLEQGVNLSNLSVALGMNNIEYEPEQFSGLVYRPENRHSTLMIFHSGKVIITGNKDENEAERAVSELIEQIEDSSLKQSD